ncbi:MAG: ROK family protein [Acidobacteria bacterium]|nr:MAG: ROK family protein [Acidobacteriota bacterium]
MGRTVGVLAMEHVAVGRVEGGRIVGAVHVFPERGDQADSLRDMPGEEIADSIRRQVLLAAEGSQVDALGVGVPGIVIDGVVADSPNLQQLKGLDLRGLLSAAFPAAAVEIRNDADTVAAGIAATRGELDRLVRVWTLGTGIGFGRYPWTPGMWEGGHCVVTLDPKERFCGCGGVGHLEGIMGHRAMRLRFLDMEPEEVFEHARQDDERCREFARMWHRALAAATATSIHFDGPGKFYITGPNAKFVDSAQLDSYLHDMVKMSPLQGSFLEVLETSDDTAIIGAGVSARLATRSES